MLVLRSLGQQSAVCESSPLAFKLYLDHIPQSLSLTDTHVYLVLHFSPTQPVLAYKAENLIMSRVIYITSMPGPVSCIYGSDLAND